MSNIKSMYAIAKLKKNIKGFGLRKFKEEALQVYEETCQLLAEGDQSRLRQVTGSWDSTFAAVNACYYQQHDPYVHSNLDTDLLTAQTDTDLLNAQTDT